MTHGTDLVTTREALAILNYSDPSTISKMVKSGRLEPAHKMPGKRGGFLFNRADVEAIAKTGAEAAA